MPGAQPADLAAVLALRPPRREPVRVTGDDWYRIEAKADKPKTAEVWIYDTIGSSLFEEGTDAKSFANKLQALDVEEIVLHINSPGGDAFDGIAIYNTLRDHKANVTAIVDGLAASAASFIAQAGDVVRMNRGSQMMIHDASGLVIGNAGDMEDFASTLNKVSDSIAGIYASRAGGTVAEWREAMGVESWYTAQEAVDAGLADEVASEEPADPPARNAFDLSVFAYAGRDAAPKPVFNRRPKPSPEPAGAKVTPAEAARRIHAAPVRSAKEGAGMDPAKIREALGLKADASDDEVKATLASAGLAAQPTPEPAPEPTPATTPEPAQEPKPELAHASGTITIDASAWQEREDRIKRLEARDAERRREERDQVLAQAIADGKFPPARKEHWVRMWDADPEGARQVIAGLARNVVPVAELGYAGEDFDGIDDEFKHLFPPVPSEKGA